MADCNIIKVTGNWSMFYGTGTPSRNKPWAARCPQCKEIILTPHTANSRKVAKDWLFLHMKARH